MARTKDHERRTALALEAIEVLEREGTTISVGDLAAKIGIKRPTLLYHFPTYASIAEEAIKHYLMAAQQFINKRLTAYDHPIDRLYQHALAVAEYQRGKEARFLFLTQVIASTAGLRAPVVAQATNTFFEAHRAMMVKRLEDGIAQGLVAPCNPTTVVLMVRAVLDGLMIQRVATKSNTSPVYDLLWETLLAPLRREPAGVMAEQPAAGAKRRMANGSKSPAKTKPRAAKR